jgi:hypothetical protein
MDMQGRIVARHIKENIQLIDLSQLKAGNYAVKICGKDFCATKKLVIAEN